MNIFHLTNGLNKLKQFRDVCETAELVDLLFTLKILLGKYKAEFLFHIKALNRIQNCNTDKINILKA